MVLLKKDIAEVDKAGGQVQMQRNRQSLAQVRVGLKALFGEKNYQVAVSCTFKLIFREAIKAAFLTCHPAFPEPLFH